MTNDVPPAMGRLRLRLAEVGGDEDEGELSHSGRHHSNTARHSAGGHTHPRAYGVMGERAAGVGREARCFACPPNSSSAPFAGPHGGDAAAGRLYRGRVDALAGEALEPAFEVGAEAAHVLEVGVVGALGGERGGGAADAVAVAGARGALEHAEEGPEGASHALGEGRRGGGRGAVGDAVGPRAQGLDGPRERERAELGRGPRVGDEGRGAAGRAESRGVGEQRVGQRVDTRESDRGEVVVDGAGMRDGARGASDDAPYSRCS